MTDRQKENRAQYLIALFVFILIRIHIKVLDYGYYILVAIVDRGQQVDMD